MQESVETPAGPARITWFRTSGARRAVLVLGHGAGGGIDAAELQALAAALPARGVEVALVEQPWRVAGKRVAPAPKTLDLGWLPVVEHVLKDAAAAAPGMGAGKTSGGAASRSQAGGGAPNTGIPVIVGGRSAGARVACRTGKAVGAAGVVALAFPLFPPGKPEKSRAGELLGTGLPTLVVQGAADAFGNASQFPALPDTHRLVGLPAGTHEFAVRKTQEPVLGALVAAVAAWIDELPAAL
jgi:hypothetical protein